MFFRFYIPRHLKRDKGIIIIAVVLLALAITSSILSSSIAQETDKLQALETDFPIWMEVSDIKGINSDDLYIPDNYIWAFTREGEDYAITPLITDLCLKRTMEITLSGKSMDLCGITRREADSRLAVENGASVTFYEGYSWDDFNTDEAVCLIPDSISGDAINVVFKDDNNISVSLTPIGIVYGGSEDVIYCPWEYINLLENTYFEGIIYSEALRARVRDNRRMDELKTELKQYFTNTDITNTSSKYSFAVTIFDSKYIQSHKSAADHISFLKFTRSASFVLFIIIGFISGFLILKYRRHEFALLRTMGISKQGIIGMFTMEYGLVCVLTLVLFTALTIFIPPLRIGFMYFFITGLCFMSGIVISIIYISAATKQVKE